MGGSIEYLVYLIDIVRYKRLSGRVVNKLETSTHYRGIFNSYSRLNDIISRTPNLRELVEGKPVAYYSLDGLFVRKG